MIRQSEAPTQTHIPWRLLISIIILGSFERDIQPVGAAHRDFELFNAYLKIYTLLIFRAKVKQKRGFHLSYCK